MNIVIIGLHGLKLRCIDMNDTNVIDLCFLCDDCFDCPLFLDFNSCGYERTLLGL